MEQIIKIVKTLAELQELDEYLRDKPLIAIDCETTGLTKEDKVIGISFAAEPNYGWYVILSYWNTAQQKLIPLQTKDGIKAVLQSTQGKGLVFHNAVFDCAMIWNNFQVELMDSVKVDTMVLSHLVDENRSHKLKDLGLTLYGEDATKEDREMKESVLKNGGQLTKQHYELYKADPDLLAKYGAKDTILTLNVLYEELPKLYEQGLDKFFFEESMPLLKGPTYELNTTGLRVDPDRISLLKGQLEAEIQENKSFVYKEIQTHIQAKYPGTSKKTLFNINSGQQLSWLLFSKLGEMCGTLTDSGKEVCEALQMRVPYSHADKRRFFKIVQDSYGQVWKRGYTDKRTGKVTKDKIVGFPWTYTSADEETLQKYAPKYKWVAALLKYKKNCKLLSTYVEGIRSATLYNIIHPSFLQCGTTSGRYSSKAPNFQNLPRNDKRIKACMVARPGKVFVGADYSQLEPRIFASTSGDPILMGCFERGEDFYSVVGAPIFAITDCSMFKDDENSFAKKHSNLRDQSKVFSLATPYGRLPGFQAAAMGISMDEAKDLIDRYFDAYPKVKQMMLDSHKMAKRDGVVYNLFGRPRRLPEAMSIEKIYGRGAHHTLPYEARNILNLAMNHRVQSTAASIVNRASIAIWRRFRELAKDDPRWKSVRLVLQCHDSLVYECLADLTYTVSKIVQGCMENTVELPGVKLEAIPKVGLDLSQV